MISLMTRRRFLLGTGSALLATRWQGNAAETPPLDPSIRRVLFLGDSITYSGLYADYVEAGWRIHFPESKVEFINMGLPSETVSGLSEPNHAGGKFPRPTLHERLDRVLAQLKPGLVIACYGMNDGIYHPFSQDRFTAYQQGILKLRDKTSAAGAQIIHLTPPVFDAQPVREKTLPAGLEVYEKPYVGYDEVLHRYSEWLLDQRSRGWTVHDVHGPMLRHLEIRRKTKPDFTLARDGVHADATGHWLMAQPLLQAWKLQTRPETRLVRPTTADVSPSIPSLTVDCGNVHLSQPYDPKWDGDSLAVEQFDERFGARFLKTAHLPEGRYHLKENGKILTTLSHADLDRGIALNRLPGLSLQRRGVELLKLIGQRRKLLCDAWLNATGHQRPGMAKGLPLADAQMQAEVLEKSIRAALNPAALNVEIAQADVPGEKK